jgi:hypothetical protein
LCSVHSKNEEKTTPPLKPTADQKINDSKVTIIENIKWIRCEACHIFSRIGNQILMQTEEIHFGLFL